MMYESNSKYCYTTKRDLSNFIVSSPAYRRQETLRKANIETFAY